MVSFTGSLQAGRCTASVAGDGIKKVCLELGGKSAFVVLDDALFDQAIAAGVNNANDSRYGLAGGVWAGMPERALNVAKQPRTGQVDINGGRFNVLAPFGGDQKSGIGREIGPLALEEFFQLKSIQR